MEALEISDNGVSDFIIGTIYYPGLDLSVTAPNWVETGMTPSPAYSSITISVGENENNDYRSGTTRINFNGCEKGFNIRQAGTKKNIMFLKIKNSSTYTTDFSNIVITVGKNPVETINVLGNISGLSGYGTVSGPILYKQRYVGNTIYCKALVRNEFHPQGKVMELTCVQNCDPDVGEEVIFEYNE